MSTATTSKLRVRQRLGKYRIERRIGEGGFAVVYQAMDTIMGTRVALKIPHGSLVDDNLLSAFRREARLVTKLEHSGILQIKDASVIDGRLVISYPLGNETLYDRVSRRMSFETSMSYTAQLLDAVTLAHDRRVIHCDIKPENVILFDDGLLKLADFGIAKVARQTVRGCGTGTVGYMAPEQAMGRPSSRSDVFSLGLITYRMLTGVWPEWPFEWPLEGHRKLKSRVHPSMITWLKKSIELDPRNRFADAGQMYRSFIRLRPTALKFIQSKRAAARRRSVDTARLNGATRRAA